MKVGEVMTIDVETIHPRQTMKDAAESMLALDIGILPVGEDDHLVGMITDRDIVIRGIAQGRGVDTEISELMTRDVKYCFEDQDIEEVTRNMGDIQVRRLPVMNRQKRLVGIVTIGDIAAADARRATAEALNGISRPGGQHTQL